ncbi:MAG: hypothetical protein QRY71_00085 [Candidatus Rhabdochlamydia sp.]
MLSSNAIYNFFSYCIYSPQPPVKEIHASQNKGQNPSCLNNHYESISDSRSFSASSSENLSPSFSIGPEHSDSSTHKTHVIWKNFKGLIENPLPLLGLLLLGNIFIYTNPSYPRLNTLIQKVTDCALLFLGALIVGFLFPSDLGETQKNLPPEEPPVIVEDLPHFQNFVQSPPMQGYRSSSSSTSLYQQPPIESDSISLQEDDIALFLNKVKEYLLPYLERASDQSFHHLFESEWDEQIAFAPHQLPVATIQNQIDTLTPKMMLSNRLSPSPIQISWPELSHFILEKIVFLNVLRNVIQKSSSQEELFDWLKGIFERECSSSLESIKDKLMLDLLSNNKNYLLGKCLEMHEEDSIEPFKLFLFS